MVEDNWFGCKRFKVNNGVHFYTFYLLGSLL